LPERGQPLGLEGLFLGLLELGDAGQARPEGVHVDRFEEVVGRPLTQGRDGAVEVGVTGDYHDGGLGGQLPEPRQQVLGRAVGQAVVEEDGGIFRPIGPAQGLGGTGGGVHPVAVHLRAHGKHLTPGRRGNRLDTEFPLITISFVKVARDG
jgi:hypothetical protein